MNESFPVWGVPADQQHGLLVTAWLLAAGSLLYSLILARKERDLFPLFVFAGAGLAVLLEPVGDIFTQVVYPHLNQVSLFSAWGRNIPLWMGPNYVFFFCVPVLLFLRYCVRPDISARAWWLTYAALVVLVAASEMPGIAAASWKYYGANPPLSFHTYPVWVGFNNAQCLVSTAVGIYGLRALGIRGARSVLLVALVPLLIAGTHIAPSLPVATATHSNSSSLTVNIAAAVTIALNILMVWVGLQLVRAARPR
jgi:hypothetical protein